MPDNAPERIWTTEVPHKIWHHNPHPSATEYIRADLSDGAIMQERCAAVCRDQWVIIPEPGTARDCYDAIRALPATTPADRLAAALRVPEVAALVEAASVVRFATFPIRGQATAIHDAIAALAALTPNEVKP